MHLEESNEQGSQGLFSNKIPGFVQVKIVILQVLVQTTLAPKGRCQMHSKIVVYKIWKKLSQYKIKMLYVLTFQVLSMFPAKFLVLSRFSHFWGQILGYFWTWTGFPGSAGKPANKQVLTSDPFCPNSQLFMGWILHTESNLIASSLTHTTHTLVLKFMNKGAFFEEIQNSHFPRKMGVFCYPPPRIWRKRG